MPRQKPGHKKYRVNPTGVPDASEIEDIEESMDINPDEDAATAAALDSSSGLPLLSKVQHVIAYACSDSLMFTAYQLRCQRS